MQLLLVWCTISLKKSDGTIEERVVRSKFLETECGKKVNHKDLYIGNILIWKAKGVPFEVQLLQTHSKSCMWSYNYVLG